MDEVTAKGIQARWLDRARRRRRRTYLFNIMHCQRSKLYHYSFCVVRVVVSFSVPLFDCQPASQPAFLYME